MVTQHKNIGVECVLLSFFILCVISRVFFVRMLSVAFLYWKSSKIFVKLDIEMRLGEIFYAIVKDEIKSGALQAHTGGKLFS